ncbi:ATP-dependent RNA helicase [Urbifossiella limnaea]|uniref:ATP-dependent RNA helicase HrpB n=1 Tax=Urbifossiella limnaea TaxID=2528023 RepID=A0A517Y0C0_9BACT|nr:ATP-dependent helicase C-terminal domain-containing protein [Urbifossiella limnaea]QDU23199.1 ATP-dependent RNA helicase HrpB [Urbifossiella limnaea]
MPRDPLPIDAALPELLAAVRASRAAVLRAPTGAGKTTRVPPALLDVVPGTVVMLEPRRVAARAAARRMAHEHGSALGDVFGYQVRFDRAAGPNTRVLVVTPGVLLRRLHDDPFLDGVGAVVFDEFHERGLDADLALGMVKLVRETVRPDLVAVVMSATIDPGPVAAYLGGAPVVDSAGRSFPVEIVYRPRRTAAEGVREALQLTDGDVLAFLPGLREIRHTADELGDLGVEVLPLHGDLPPEQQDRALQQLGRRKVVLATNVAETSVTVEGVTAVVDTGLARQLEFEPAVGMDRLRLVPISRASADQRAGRAGRTRPGVCLRLWDEPGHRARPEQTEPEIRRVDVCGAALQLLALGETDVSSFPWLDRPRPEAIDQANRLLEQLGLVIASRVVDDLLGRGASPVGVDNPTGLAPRPNGLTDLGREAARLPVHPRLGRLLVEGKLLGDPRRAALAAALLAERDPFVRPDGPPTRTAPPTASDVLDRVEALEAFERTKRLDTPVGQLHRGGAFAVLEARDQFARLLASGGRQPAVPIDRDAVVLRAVFAAYPDRLARRREPGSSRAVTVGGRGVRLAPTSGVREPELFVCADVDAAGADAFVRLASGVDRAWLPAERLTVRTDVTFDDQTERLAARKRTRFDDLILDEVQAHIADEADAARVLAAAARDRLAKVLPDPESDAGRFRTRVRCLRGWLPELNLPAFDAADLGDLLEHLARGRRSLAELRSGPWLDLMRGQLTFDQQRALDREAPDRLEVPSGSHIALQYEEGRPPVLAARIQELFGLTETPRVGGGRVKVLLHLLAPNHRPQQVTDDLASFWKTGYPLVRKELRGRYPKHSWPDDPLTAEAVRGARRRPPT